MSQSTNSNTLEGRIAVITGASAGIGKETARALASYGAKVVINARRAGKLDALVDEINQAAGAQVSVSVQGDAADEGSISRTLDAAKDTFGREADLVVINAGRGLSGGVVSSDDGQWESMIELNLLGAMRLMRESAKRMLADIDQRSDWTAHPHDIVVLGSTVGRHVSPFSGAYGATKFGVHGATEALRREVGPKGIRVSNVQPGIVLSEFQAGAGYDSEWFNQVEAKFEPLLVGKDIADAVLAMVTPPPHVHLCDIIVRATRQDYP